MVWLVGLESVAVYGGKSCGLQPGEFSHPQSTTFQPQQCKPRIPVQWTRLSLRRLECGDRLDWPISSLNLAVVKVVSADAGAENTVACLSKQCLVGGWCYHTSRRGLAENVGEGFWLAVDK